MRAIRAAAFFAWLAWTAWVAAHYFAVPGELLVVVDRPFDGLPFWRTALVDALRALGSAAVVILAAWGTGSLAMRQMRDALAPGAERVLVVLAAGFAALSAILLTLAALHLYRPAIVGGTCVAGALAGIAHLRSFAARMARARGFVRASAGDLVFGACAAAAIGAAFVGALAPETEYDALWYHLWLPVQWLEAGRPVDIVHEYPSLYPLSWELLNGAAMVMGGPVAAKLLHFACLPLAGAATFLLSRRLFPGASAMLAAALAMAAPIAIWEATTAYIDLALAWHLAVSVLALLRYHDSRDRRWLIVSACLLGAAAAVKHLALVALAVVTCVVIGLEIHARGRPGVRMRKAIVQALALAALFAAVSLLLPAPWYVRAYTASGNPVFPDMYGVFGGGPADRWSPDAERGLQAFKDRFGTPRTAKNLLSLPWDATVHAARFGGTLGPLFLVLVPCALIGRRVRAPAAVLAAGCSAYGLVWASPVSSYQMRFVIPLLPFLAALGAEGAVRVQRAARVTGPLAGTAVTAIVCGLLLFNLPPLSGWHEPDRDRDRGWMTHIVRGLPAAVVLGVESKDEYLARTVASYRAWQFINSSLPAEARILTFSGGDHLYSHRQRLWSDSTAARPSTWGAAAGQERAALEALRARGISHVLFDRRLIEDGEAKSLAIASGTMRLCCLEREYEDGRFALYRVRGTLDGIDPSSGGIVLDGAEARGR